ncbi:glycine--tRNA ligase subunit beta [Woodsholea maritima]|uniref:glycine--tRNA ligase subunit beta n=1 Tax=Woodsholea maritima TaxID=240237 RepID=UPI0003610D5F|nr:glycine--tRNA ligase subunit beta [Woodsholea maritima]
MSEFLFEIFCEEIPARMQLHAQGELEKLFLGALAEAGLKPQSHQVFSGPRRLTLVLNGLPEKTEDVREERKGPRVGAPEKAVEGFLRGAGIASLDQCETRADNKGEYYVALIEKPGRETKAVLAEAIETTIKGFSWPKSMKFGEGETLQRWVRPIQRLTAIFNGEVIPAKVFGLETGNVTEGHRVHGRGPFSVASFSEYAEILTGEGHVMIDRVARQAKILADARQVCLDAGLELVEDGGLLAEVTGLVEHPIALLGDMDPDFLTLPPEVITLTMKVHQKYFAVKDPQTGKLAAKFVVIANQAAPDGGKAIAAGNARVLSARLSDARHFWDLDRKTPLSAMAGELSKVTFHKKLGSVADKVERVAQLARELAPIVGADADLAEKAARLAKADLVSQMVYEFPELQGAMGRYYALEQGEDSAVADAIKAHYQPQGPSDDVPTAPVSAAVALADKLDTLVGFWAIDEKPTGSKDPFALRRAALGVIRIALEGNVRLGLHAILTKAGEVLGQSLDVSDLLAFFADRLKVHLKDEGLRHDIIDAVFAPNKEGVRDDDLVRVTHKARALQAFLNGEDGAALVAGYKRAANILKAEEKKDGAAYDGVPEADYVASAPEAAERALISALDEAGAAAKLAMDAEDFTAAMAALAKLRAPVDSFFDAVVVNVTEGEKAAMLRRNRLLLLSCIRAAVRNVADFDRLEG